MSEELSHPLLRAIEGASLRREHAAVVGLVLRSLEHPHIDGLWRQEGFMRGLDAASGERFEVCFPFRPMDLSPSALATTPDPERVIFSEEIVSNLVKDRRNRYRALARQREEIAQRGLLGMITSIIPFDAREFAALCHVLEISALHDLPCLALMFPIAEDEALTITVPILGSTTDEVFNDMHRTLSVVKDVIDGFDVSELKNGASLHREVSGRLGSQRAKKLLVKGVAYLVLVAEFIATSMTLSKLS